MWPRLRVIQPGGPKALTLASVDKPPTATRSAIFPQWDDISRTIRLMGSSFNPAALALFIAARCGYLACGLRRQQAIQQPQTIEATVST
ncbi:hypothetical protein KCP69_12975 [Salmonella enterica subsp. enterica]|nr:hypothetical protein KCP69_12975 [Salmonella enterica subsp. enterica]